MSHCKDLLSLVFGRLTVISFVGVGKNKRAKWLCQCTCGNTIIRNSRDLISGHTKSCGCLHKDVSRQRKLKHGHTTGGIKTPIYSTWTNMMSRCYTKTHRDYRYWGGRGISVCKRWHEFENFVNDMESTWFAGLSLDRINNNGNYKPSNCRWATHKEQAQNRRTTKKARNTKLVTA